MNNAIGLSTCRQAIVGAAFLALSTVAFAQTGMRLEFLDPTGVVAPDAEIPVWVRLTLSQPLDFSIADPYPFGLPASTIPSVGYDETPVTPDATFQFAAFELSYTNGPSGGADLQSSYKLNFVDSTDPRAFGYGQFNTLHVDAGVHDYLVATLTPKSEMAPGTYRLPGTFDLGIFLGFQQPNTGHDSFLDIELISTCQGSESGCSFARTVSVVPEPATLVLMSVGLVGLSTRRSRRA